jgi:hypothetical protein
MVRRQALNFLGLYDWMLLVVERPFVEPRVLLLYELRELFDLDLRLNVGMSRFSK